MNLYHAYKFNINEIMSADKREQLHLYNYLHITVLQWPKIVCMVR